MSTAVDICNLALNRLGDSATLVSLDPPEGTPQADHCARFYPLARREMFEVHNWTFLMAREKLAERSDIDTHGWQYVYALPQRMIHAVRLGREGDVDFRDAERFVIENDERGQRVLYTDCPNAVLRFTRDTEDTSNFSPGFIDALAWLLASHLAGSMISGLAGAKQSATCINFYKETLANAIKRDAQQQRVLMPAYPYWLKHFNYRELHGDH